MGFTLDMVINAKGQVTSGTFNSNDKTKGNYTIRKGGTVELGGSRDGFYISTVKDIPVTPTGGNGSFTMSLSIPAGPK